MKKTAIIIIKGYQIFISSFFKQVLGIQRSCRFDVTCSQYAVNSIEKYGMLKGSKVAFLRFLKCQPFSNAYVRNI